MIVHCIEVVHPLQLSKQSWIDLLHAIRWNSIHCIWDAWLNGFSKDIPSHEYSLIVFGIVLAHHEEGVIHVFLVKCFYIQHCSFIFHISYWLKIVVFLCYVSCLLWQSIWSELQQECMRLLIVAQSHCISPSHLLDKIHDVFSFAW